MHIWCTKSLLYCCIDWKLHRTIQYNKLYRKLHLQCARFALKYFFASKVTLLSETYLLPYDHPNGNHSAYCHLLQCSTILNRNYSATLATLQITSYALGVGIALPFTCQLQESLIKLYFKFFSIFQLFSWIKVKVLISLHD
jgi:hypothetical protein